MSVASPIPKRWTVEECYQLQEAGILKGRYELIDGDIYDKMGQKPPHSLTLQFLMGCLFEIFGWSKVRVQSPIALPAPYGAYSEPEPDIAVTKEEAPVYTRHPLPEDLFFVAEVSDTSLRFDMQTKAQLYAQAGIAEYWLLDVANRRLMVYREPSADGYRETRLYSEQETVSPLALPNTPIAVSRLFPPLT